MDSVALCRVRQVFRNWLTSIGRDYYQSMWHVYSMAKILFDAEDDADPVDISRQLKEWIEENLPANKRKNRKLRLSLQEGIKEFLWSQGVRNEEQQQLGKVMAGGSR